VFRQNQTSDYAPAGSPPSRKSALIRYSANATSPASGEIVPKSQLVAGLNSAASNQPRELTHDEFLLLLREKSSLPKIPSDTPGFRAGFGHLFPEKSSASAHPNDQRLEDRSWLYV